MVAIVNMTVICFSAKTMIENVGADNGYHCRNDKYKRRIGEYYKLVEGK